jgi:hypothetical protein
LIVILLTAGVVAAFVVGSLAVMTDAKMYFITLKESEGAVVFREDQTFDLMLRRDHTHQWVMHMLALVKTLMKTPTLIESVEEHLVKKGVIVMDTKSNRGAN